MVGTISGGPNAHGYYTVQPAGRVRTELVPADELVRATDDHGVLLEAHEPYIAGRIIEGRKRNA